MSFSRILIANRGEIACRIIRSAQDLGYATVAVFSDADADAPHVHLADQAVRIGPVPAAESYLSIDALLDAARKTGADAVHPGYGFLSENADFAQACLDAGLVFIGPPPAAMRAMGDKAQAKRRMLAAGVPCAPGYLGDAQDEATLTVEAVRLGFPLLVKAVAGGGGRGMRRVDALPELTSALEAARREAHNAFGDGTLMLERLIERGRHIEVQVFADAHGHVVHMGERDCTAQRRRQKVIEEAPSPVVAADLGEALGRDAVAAARAVGYCGAGTVEFLLDAEGRHYFLEMNTRLQVEHPVTELVTGLDLVAWQLRVAAGEPLPLAQADIHHSGHAIEVRLYAEDPYAGFTPQTGTVLHWRPLQPLPAGVRLDSGIAEGSTVSPWYDPLLAKVIAHGRDRDEAIRRLRAALARMPLLGLRHNGGFLCDLLDHPAFREARMHTALLDQWLNDGEPLLQRPVPDDAAWCVAAAALVRRQGSSWRPSSVAAFDLTLRCGEQTQALRVDSLATGELHLTLGGTLYMLRHVGVTDNTVSYELNSVKHRLDVAWSGFELHIAMPEASFVFSEVSPFPQADAAFDAALARAPVAGRVSRVQVAVGDVVRAGQPMVCVEAMKMDMWLTAQAPGRVRALHTALGEQVVLAAVVVELDLDEMQGPGSDL
jgi:geranyl-CoA carboxylase alpha subunit